MRAYSYLSISGAATYKNGEVGGEQQSFEFNVNFAKRGSGLSNRYVEKLWANRRIGEIIDQIDLNGKNQELMDELIRLAKRHGIVTPYTSFLADENQAASQFANRDDNRAIVDRDLAQLEAEPPLDDDEHLVRRDLEGPLRRHRLERRAVIELSYRYTSPGHHSTVPLYDFVTC